MSVEEFALKTAAQAVRGSIPKALHLFAAFRRRDAARFRTISQQGAVFRRARLTGALALICGIASYFVVKLDPFRGIAGVLGAPEVAAWAAVVPLLAIPPMYWLLRWHSKGSILHTFWNLGLVTSTLLMVIPSLLIFAGGRGSMLDSDVEALLAGRGAGTPIHAEFCGFFDDGAAMEATMRADDRLMIRLAHNSHELMANTRLGLRSRQEVDARGHEMLRARAAGEPPAATVEPFFAEIEHGLEIMRRGNDIRQRGLAIHRENSQLLDRMVDLENHRTFAFWRILSAYPVATFFLALASVVALLIWTYAGIIAWRLIVTPQEARRRKIFAGTSLVILFFILMAGFGMLRSNMLDALLKEPPTREMLVARLRAQFAAVAPYCGQLNYYGLW